MWTRSLQWLWKWLFPQPNSLRPLQDWWAPCGRDCQIVKPRVRYEMTEGGNAWPWPWPNSQPESTLTDTNHLLSGNKPPDNRPSLCPPTPSQRHVCLDYHTYTGCCNGWILIIHWCFVVFLWCTKSIKLPPKNYWITFLCDNIKS